MSEPLVTDSLPVEHAALTVETTSTPGIQPGWLHTNLRSLLALALCAVVCWLALHGEQAAQAALVAAFSVLVGHIFGERAALKRPGADS